MRFKSKDNRQSWLNYSSRRGMCGCECVCFICEGKKKNSVCLSDQFFLMWYYAAGKILLMSFWGCMCLFLPLSTILCNLHYRIFHLLFQLVAIRIAHLLLHLPFAFQSDPPAPAVDRRYVQGLYKFHSPESSRD